MLTVGVIGAAVVFWFYFSYGLFKTDFKLAAPVESDCKGVFSKSEWTKAQRESEDVWDQAWDDDVRTKAQIQGDDLIACGTLNGMTVQRVEELLGEGTQGTLNDGSEVLFWFLGYERRFASTFYDILLLKIDENGRVVSSKLGRDEGG